MAGRKADIAALMARARALGTPAAQERAATQRVRPPPWLRWVDSSGPKGDGEPEVKTIWAGLQRVMEYAAGRQFERELKNDG